MKQSLRISLFSLITCIALWAQAISSSQIKGTVQDSSGAAVPGVEVTVTGTATGQVRTATSAADGSYVLPDLPIGPYQLEATKDGFSKYVQTGIVLQVGSSPTIDVALKVGAVSERVVVEADATMVETHSTGVGQVVDQQRVVDLPLNGRNPQQLIFLAGAATTGVNSDVVAAGKNYPVLYISVAGGGSNGMTYLLDGGTHNDPQNSLELPLPFPDALQEFKVETSALPAQYGQHSAAAVNAVTKSGGNEFHGDAFEFVRNGDFNARNFFAPIRDSLKRNQFGGTVGGPIKKNKLFFFAGYQGTIQRSNPIGGTTSGITTSTGVSYVPTPAMLGGDFTAFESPACNGGKQVTLKTPFVNNTISPALINVPGLNFAKTLPPATNQCGLVLFGVPNNENEHQGLARIDYQLSAKHSLFGRYYTTHLLIPPPDVLANPLNGGTPGQTSLVQSLVLGDTYLIGTSIVNSFRITGNRVYDTRVVQSSFSTCALGTKMYCIPLPTPQTTWIAITGGATDGGSAGNPGLFATDTYQFADDVSFVRGAHQISFGVNWIHDAMNSSTYSYTNGDFSFTGQTTGSGYGDLFDGIAATMKQSAISGFQPRQAYFGAYFQDSWRVNSRLSVNAGVRWEPFMPVTSHTGFLSNFQESWFLAGVHSTVFPNAPAGVLYPGDAMPGGSKLPAAAAFGKIADFAPRLGVVWDPKGDGRMTVRAAYGVFYDLPNLYWSSNIERQPPFGDLVSLANVNFSNPYGSGVNPFPYTPSASAPFPIAGAFYNWPLHPQPTYLQQWNLTIQRQFGANWLVSAGYLGNRTVHEWSTIDADQAVFLGLGPCSINGTSYTTCSTTSNSNQRRLLNLLNPSQGQYYSNLNQMDDGGTQSYNGMLLAVQHRLSNNFSVQANYAWSHCIGIPQNYELTGVSYIDPNRNHARGDCLTVDRRQIANISALGEMPKFANRWMRILASEWKISAILSAQTGAPIDITTGVDNALVGTPTSVTGTGERPNLILGSPYPTNQSIHDYINPAAFATPASGTFGNLGEGVVRAPGLFTLDMAVSRVFPIREKQRLELRGEAFNIANRANFLAPNGVENTGTFGQITTAGDPRIMQLALKLYF